MVTVPVTVGDSPGHSWSQLVTVTVTVGHMSPTVTVKKQKVMKNIAKTVVLEPKKNE